MNRFKQPSTWAGLTAVIVSIFGILSGTVDTATAQANIVAGLGLVAANA